MNKYALIRGGVVIGVQVSTNKITSPDLVAVDGDFPVIGSNYSSGVFTPPQTKENKIRIISIGAFRRRLTLNEKLAIKTSDDPVVAVLNDDLNASSFIDLDFDQLKEGLNYFVTVGILNAERIEELLQDGTNSEKL